MQLKRNIRFMGHSRIENTWYGEDFCAPVNGQCKQKGLQGILNILHILVYFSVVKVIMYCKKNLHQCFLSAMYNLQHI